MIGVGDRVKIKDSGEVGTVLNISTVQQKSWAKLLLDRYAPAITYSYLHHLELVTSSTNTPVSNRFIVGQKVKALVDGPGHVTAGDVVEVVKVFVTSISGDNEFMYDHSGPAGVVRTHTGVETNFSADPNAPIQPSLWNQTTLPVGQSVYGGLYVSPPNLDAQVPEQKSDKKSECQCGSHSVGSPFHSQWCPEFNKQKESK